MDPPAGWFLGMIIATFILSLLFLALFVPVQGVVTRFRINYTPKGVGLGGEGGGGDEQVLSQDMRVGPVVNSVWAMFGRVKRLEGYQGFFKGLMPLLILIFVNYLAGIIIIGSASARRAIDAGGPISSAFWALVITLISIPGEILVNRAVTTPHKLGWFAPRTSLKALFTTYERSRPYVLFLTPGLALAQILHVLYFLTIARGFRAILVPSYTAGGIFLNTDEQSGVHGFWGYIGLAVYTIFLCLSFVVLTPLEVLSARLSVQRNHPRGATALPTSAPGASPEEEEMLAGEGLEYAGAEEDVIALRDEGSPYVSLVDAYKKVREEEGAVTLYRCWWLTLLAAITSGFA